MKKNTVKQDEDNPNYSGKQQIIDTEIGMPIYSKSIVKRIYKGLDLRTEQNNLYKIIDFGAGTGYLAELFSKNYSVIPTAVEIDPDLQKIIKEREIPCVGNIGKIQGKVQYIYSSNVLEHIEDDLGLLKQLNKKLADGGKLALYLPALPFLYSEMDKQIGHFRRYKKNELKIKLRKAGFVVEHISFDDPLGVIASLIVKTMKYKKILGIRNVKTLIFYDRIIYPLSNLLGMLLFKRFIGKNLLVIARKENQIKLELPNQYGSVRTYYKEYFNNICYGNLIASRSMDVIHKKIEKQNADMYYQRTLELGAGSGQHLNYVKHGYDEYYLTDLKKPEIDKKFKNNTRIRIMAVNAENIPFPEAYFDRIVVTCLLHHVDQPEVALKEINRVLKEDGSATIFLPCDPGLLLRLIRSMTSAKRAKKLGFQGYDLLNARDHRNHIGSLLKMIEFAFSKRKIQVRYAPFHIPTWNLNTYILIEVN
jgi:SAM-dependent methyltransferase